MKSTRQKQISSLIQRELAQVLLRHNEQPVFKMITLVGVEVSPDLAIAKVFFSVLDETKVDAALKALHNATGLLRHALAQNLNLRITPRLTFIYDESIVRGRELSALIDKAIAQDAQLHAKQTEET